MFLFPLLIPLGRFFVVDITIFILVPKRTKPFLRRSLGLSKISLEELTEKKIETIAGLVQCRRCEKQYEMGFNLREKFIEKPVVLSNDVVLVKALIHIAIYAKFRPPQFSHVLYICLFIPFRWSLQNSSSSTNYFRVIIPSPTDKVFELMDTQEIEVVSSDEIRTNESEEKETRDEMLSRHRKETKQLQNKETELKKEAAKGSKAEQKAKKKEVEEQISQLSTELKEKQAEELALLGYIGSSSSNGNEKANLDTLVKAIAGVSVTNQQENVKVSKGAKRRGKRAQQEAEREQRIQEEQSNLVSDRMIENEQLKKKLEPLQLTVHEIKPDGHCLFRAIEDQLAIHSGGCSPYNFQDLRRMVAAYMRDHMSEFLPFFLSEDTTEGNTDGSLAERFENYCKEVESTSAWGGHLELNALTHCLKRPVVIYSGSMPEVEMGKEYKSDGVTASSNAAILLSYHIHAFGLGEHYNSVVPNLIK